VAAVSPSQQAVATADSCCCPLSDDLLDSDAGVWGFGGSHALRLRPVRSRAINHQIRSLGAAGGPGGLGAGRRLGPTTVPGWTMAGQARDLPMRTKGESSVIITARACPVPPRPTGAGPKPRSTLGPCRNGRARASAVTVNGHQRSRGTAGRRPSSSNSSDDARGRFGLCPEGRVGDVGAADGQQPVSVTTGEPARKQWRIMTVDSPVDGH
jgi:hypothetical protein